MSKNLTIEIDKVVNKDLIEESFRCAESEKIFMSEFFYQNLIFQKINKHLKSLRKAFMNPLVRVIKEDSILESEES